MPDYSMRLHVELAPCDRIGASGAQLELDAPGLARPIVIASADPDLAIEKNRNLVVRSSGFADEESALAHGRLVSNALKLTLARLHMGADFGDRQPSSAFFPAGLAMIKKKVGRRVLNDVLGVMAFETEPRPVFATPGTVTVVRTMQIDRIRKVFAGAFELSRVLDDRTTLAFELYNASFFELGVRSRFLILMMAIEALLVPAKRPDKSRQHIRGLMKDTRNAAELSTDEKCALLSALGRLKYHSIAQLGRQLAESRVPGRMYAGLSATEFFSECYELRGKLVHSGGAIPLRNIGARASTLEGFVADLLSFELVEFDDLGSRRTVDPST